MAVMLLYKIDSNLSIICCMYKLQRYEVTGQCIQLLSYRTSQENNFCQRKLSNLLTCYNHFRFLLDYLSNQLVYGMELVGKDAVNVFMTLLGDQDPNKAAPGTIRAMYGLDPIRNCAHSSTSLQSAMEVIKDL